MSSHVATMVKGKNTTPGNHANKQARNFCHENLKNGKIWKFHSKWAIFDLNGKNGLVLTTIVKMGYF